MRFDNTTCCSLDCSCLRHELGHSFFHLLEQNGKVIDVQKSFAPSPTKKVIGVKTALFVWNLATLLFVNFSQFKTPYFCFAYLTQWALVFTLLYQFLSIVVSIKFSAPSDAEPPPQTRATKHWLFVQITWCLFSIASTLELVVGLMYWFFHFVVVDKPLTYLVIMAHGGVGALLFADGLVINRIPLRVRQVVFPMLVGCSYALWTIIHWKLDIGNPEEEFDSIYEILDWEKDKVMSSILISMLIFVAIPLGFFLVRMFSLWSGWLQFDGKWLRLEANIAEEIGDFAQNMVKVDSDSDSQEHSVQEV